MPDAPAFDADFRRELLTLLAWRRDVRRFRRDLLPPGTIQRLLGAAALAPSVGLSQPWRFVLVEAPERRAEIKENFERCNAAALAAQSGGRAVLYTRLKLEGLDEAPCHLAVFADRGTRRGHRLGRTTMPQTIEYSAVAAVHSLWILARAEGIGMGWVSILNPKAVATILDVPKSWRFIGYFCLGYPLVEDEVPELEREAWERRQDPAAFLFRR